MADISAGGVPIGPDGIPRVVITAPAGEGNGNTNSQLLTNAPNGASATNNQGWANLPTTGKGSLAKNPNYWVALRTSVNTASGTSPIAIVGNTPETFSIALENEWESLVSSLFGQSSGIAGGALKFAGFAYLPQIFTTQIWKGTSPLEFSIPFQFNAHTDALKEVVQPIRDLIRISSPYRTDNTENTTNAINSIGSFLFSGTPGSVDSSSLVNNINAKLFNPGTAGGVLHAPGPTFQETFEGKGQSAIELIVGQAMYFPSVVIRSLTIEWDARYTPEGYPIAALATVGVRTAYTLDRSQYLAAIFPNAQTAGS